VALINIALVDEKLTKRLFFKGPFSFAILKSTIQNNDFKMRDLKKWFLKIQLSVTQNRKLACKIPRFKKKSSYLLFEKADFYVFKSQFLKTQIPNDFCFVIWIKIVLIIYEIIILYAP